MNGALRRARTLELLAAHGQLTVEELSARLDVTESTVRRDLQRLSAEGRLTRTLGGAALPTPGYSEPSLAQRSQTARAEKEAIARYCASLVADGEKIILDAGTTTGRLAAALRSRTSLTVFTNGLTSIMELAAADDVEVVVLGGRIRHISQGLVGALTDLSLSRVTADRVFLGADAIRADLGICEADLEQTRTKELMAQRGRKVYVLADSSKLDQAPFDAWADVGEYTLITDSAATPAQLASFERAPNVEVVVVNPVS
ncbi:DeoR/GlpR family DNA-binding transcription regulator [Microbacterium sp. RG1]|uniref:DeoR/GlpR family DNA-binding transcription regulator n=1 Tax=Microbacterium sp. RG1 TaxID=2489212 RepID=UPI0010CA5306|nr:DeoR/GlpR family DNA-binding transcription regulator [Microbacterium sp. RG1]QCQ17591.1 DeoR/GlpR transcriptional regulator [Microbacterium sp. RG1]